MWLRAWMGGHFVDKRMAVVTAHHSNTGCDLCGFAALFSSWSTTRSSRRGSSNAGDLVVCWFTLTHTQSRLPTGQWRVHLFDICPRSGNMVRSAIDPAWTECHTWWSKCMESLQVSYMDTILVPILIWRMDRITVSVYSNHLLLLRSYNARKSVKQKWSPIKRRVHRDLVSGYASNWWVVESEIPICFLCPNSQASQISDLISAIDLHWQNRSHQGLSNARLLIQIDYGANGNYEFEETLRSLIGYARGYPASKCFRSQIVLEIWQKWTCFVNRQSSDQLPDHNEVRMNDYVLPRLFFSQKIKLSSYCY